MFSVWVSAYHDGGQVGCRHRDGGKEHASLASDACTGAAAATSSGGSVMLTGLPALGCRW